MNEINWHDERNLSMLMDFYELTMANGYLLHGLKDKITYFDMFFRDVPEHGGYAIMAGVEQLIDYLNHLKFTEEDLRYLRGRNMFSEEFLNYLAGFRFTGDVWAIPEGTPIFPHEPVVIVRGPAIEAQLVETMVLISINHQSLIATKSNRIVRAAEGRPVMEFGARRAQGYDAAILGARAAYIGGCVGTSCTITDKEFGAPALGTMAHSFVMLPGQDHELDAFRQYAQVYPDDCTLLVDTYDVLRSGVPNAITVFKEEVVPRGFRPKGIRIDSGDTPYLTKEARRMLDEAGFPDCKIVVSDSLDEYKIQALLKEGAPIDSFGVGERLITSMSAPVFGGVYKLVAVEDEQGQVVPRIKISEDVEKITNPGFKQVYRLFDRGSGKAIADVVTLHEEEVDDSQPYELFDPVHTWKRKRVTDYRAEKLLVQIFEHGRCVYECPDIQSIRKRCAEQVETLWEEVLRFDTPHRYYVDLSLKLWKMKTDLLYRFSSK